MKFLQSRRFVIGLISLGLAAFAGQAHSTNVDALGISYAYYDPLSLILKDKLFLQDALGKDVKINWVLSQGSNKALEFLRGNSIQFGQTAGSAALLGRANGTPVQAIGVTTNAEWTAIVVPATSTIKTVADLKGRRVAATPGTDPYIFLLRTLAANGLSSADITLVPLQHPLGRQALDGGQVDAWAGLDPYMAEAQLQSRDVLVYRNKSFITPGTLLVRDDFAAAHPAVVEDVLKAYARARAWVIANPDETAAILAKNSSLPIAVAKLQLSRCDFAEGALGPAAKASILAAGPVLKTSGKLSAGADLDKAEATLINTSFTADLGIK